jgi:signal transduction histidine kinase
MGLKSKLLSLNLTVMAVTIGAAVLAGACYLYLQEVLNQKPSGIREEIIIMEGESVLYQSAKLSPVEIKGITMSIRMGNPVFSFENGDYLIEYKSFGTQNQRALALIRLVPKEINGSGYIPLVMTVLSVFLIVFAASYAAVQRKYTREVILPVLSLKNAASKLRGGELDTPISDEGAGEVGELAGEIEQLRLALKNTLYYQNKVDENRKFLITSISHDLKTPVTAIRGYIEGILDGVAITDEKRQAYLKSAVAKTKLIDTMIEDLLLYSKLDLNQMTFEFEKTDMLSYMEDAACENRILFENEGMELNVENRLSTGVFVLLDREKFRRVVQNIFDNARRNMAEGGTLSVILRETNAAVILEFRDSGKGISEEDLPHIFERFYKGDAARSTGGSSGMGLAIAKQIVEAHGGSIWAVSPKMQGTSVNISLKKTGLRA